jgi:hypothetical protein
VISGAGGTITNLTIDDNPGTGTPISNLSGLTVLTSLTGNLNICRLGQNGATVTDLSGLANLANVGGTVTIGGTATNANPSLTNIALAGLTSIGGALNVQYNNNVSTFSFAALGSIGTNATLANNGAGGSLSKTINFPSLVSVSGNLTIQNNGTGVTSIGLGNLNSVSGNLNLSNNIANATSANVNLGALGTVNGNLTLTRVVGLLTLNGLNVTNGLTISNNSTLTTISTVGTVTIGGVLSITNNPMLTQILMAGPFGGSPSDVSITGNTALQNVNMGLTNVTGNLTLQGNGTGVSAIVLDDLTNIGGNLSMSNTAANAIAANINLSALTNVGGSATFVRTAGTLNASALINVNNNLTISQNSTLTNFDLSFSALSGVGGNLVLQNNPQLNTCCRVLCDVVVTGSKNISGNASGCSTMASINETCTPLLCPTAQTRDTDLGECTYTAEDSEFNFTCSAPPAISYNLTGATTSGPHLDLNGIAFNLGTTTVTVTVTTASPATTATCSFTVTVNDNEAPTLTCPEPDNPYGTDPGACDASLEFEAGAEDNCGIDTIIYEIDGGTITFPYNFPVGTTTVDVIVTDENGNTATCSFTVVVEDNEPPMIDCPINATVEGECNYTVVGAELDPTTSDNCPTPSLSYSLSGATTGTGNNSLDDSVLNVGLTTIEWIVSDAGGNTETCQFTVEVQATDDEEPTLTCPEPDGPYDTDPGACDASLEFEAEAEDNCGIDTIIYEIDGGTITFPYNFPVGTTTVDVIVTDENGNTATCSFVVVVEDNQEPEIMCPEDVTVSTETDTCVYFHEGMGWDAEATDNCITVAIAYVLDGVTLGSGTSLDGVTFNFGATIVTWTATDGSGNSTTCSFTVTVIDDVPPVVISTTYGLPPGENPDIDNYACGETVIVPISSGCSALKTVTRPVWEDNCWNPVVRSQSANNGVTLAVTPGTPGFVTGNFPAGITTITFTGTDAANNTGTCTLNVWVQEPIPPVITYCPPDITVAAGPDSCSKTLSFAATATDNCGGVSIVYSVEGNPITSPYAFPVGETSVLVEAIDLSGNITTCLFSVTVQDTQLPVIVCPDDITTDAEAGECFASVEFEVEAMDNCVVFALDYCCSFVSPFNFPVGTTTVVAVATDNSGNSNTCSFTVTVKEEVPPVFATCPTAPIDLGCNPDEPLDEETAIEDAGDVTENCELESVQAEPGSITEEGCTHTQIWTVTATDVSGNTAVCEVVYTWTTDTEAPEFAECPVDSINLGCNPAALPDSAAVMEVVGSITDNCGIQAVAVLSGSVGVSGCERTQIWTVTATDLCGNTAHCMVTYTWTIDTRSPVFHSCPTAPINLGCNPTAPMDSLAVSAAGSVTDSCGTPELSATGSDIADIGCARIQVWTVRAADSCGNAATCAVTFVWTADTVKPVIATCPTAPVNLGCNPTTLPDSAAVRAAVGSITDNCGGAPVVAVSSGAVSGTGCVREQVWTVTATDACGNRDSCVVTYTWTADTVKPVFASCPTGPISIGCNPTSLRDSAAVRAAVGSITDNCGGAPVVAVSSGAVSGTGCVREQVWTVTATDACGNTGTCVVTYTWTVDTVKPVIASCPTAPVNLGCNPTSLPDSAAVRSAVGSITDNCGGVPVVGVLSGAVSGTGCARAQVWTLTATDACGNRDSCLVTYTWTADTVKPVFATCPTVPVNLGCNPTALPDSAAVRALVGSITDNCGGVPVVATVAGSITGECVKTRVWTVTATDACGNSATCTVTFQWTEGSAGLSITCPNPQNLSLGEGCSALLPDYRDSAAVVSACATVASVVQSPAPGTSVSGVGAMTVTLTVTDGCGGSTSCTFTVNKVDNRPPTVTCPATQNLTLGATCTAILPDYAILATATDNCTTTPVITQSPPAGSTVAGAGPMTITLSAGDASANKSTCTFTVNKVDNTPPTFTFMPANVTVQCSNLSAAGSPSATDACGSVTITHTDAFTPGACPDAGTIVRTWKATDGSGNTVTATQVITVVDTQAPNFVGVADITVQCYAVPAPNTPTATDNCDTDVAITYNGQTRTNGSCVNQYILVRRWTATDNCGNTRSVTQRITVIDTNRPFFTSFPANVTIQCSDPTPPVASPTASDSCGTATVTYLGQAITAGPCANSFVIRRSWRATDQCGNSTVQTQFIQVVDTTPPTFTSVPANVTITCPNPLPPVGTPTATDNCMGSVSISYLGQTASGSCPSGHTVTRTWRATDVCGNSTTAVQVITVLPPSFGPDEEVEARDGVKPQAPVWDDDRLLTLQPNPTTDRVLIGLGRFSGERVVVSIHNDMGQLLWERTVEAVPDLLLPVSLRESGASAGLHTVSVRSSNRVVAKRLVLIE